MKDTMSYKDAMRAKKDEAIAEQEGQFYAMTRKGQLAGTGSDFKTAQANPYGPVSTAPASVSEPAKQVERFSGKGGYEYGQLPDGSFMILKSGRGAAPGTVVKEGMRGYKEIKSEFEALKAGKPISSKPRSAAPKSAPKSEAPKSEAPKVRGRPNSPSMQSMRDEPRGGESMQEPGDPRMGESLRDAPRISSYGPAEYERTKARLGLRK
jgi:hypothetical protein